MILVTLCYEKKLFYFHSFFIRFPQLFEKATQVMGIADAS